MKKIFTIFLSAVCLISVMSLTAWAKEYRTSISTPVDNSDFTLEIKDGALIVSGTVQKEDLKYLLVTLNRNFLVKISSEIKFSSEIAIPEVKENVISVSISLGKELAGPYVGLFYGDDIVMENVDGKWYFVLDNDVMQKNSTWQKGYINYKDQLNPDQPNAVKIVTSSLVEGIESDYDKAFAIHKWISDNIYYDKDYALTPVEVLTERVTVCEGYANLAVSMLNAAGIPAVLVKGYALGLDSAKSWSEVSEDVKPNHAWVEAYVDGRWISMDPTWDSKNMSEGESKKTIEAVAYRYFDISPEFLSSDHMILDRPNVFGYDGISFWAEKEVVSAMDKGLVISSHLKTLKKNITREEFCDIVVNLISVKLGKQISEVLKDKGLTVNKDFFVDTEDMNILAANALGIVYGKENNRFDPHGFITRQEAAVMLQRTSKVLGVTTPNSEKLDFADKNTFPAWSRDAIDFVSASLSPEGTRVMGGVENNRFDPTGLYTKEQSILTIYRLFNAYK